MGRMQREKGKRFERDIANVFRERWPNAVVRRASQAERADNPDVFVADGPELLKQLWLELQDARDPTPGAKLVQAEGDIAHRHYHRGRLPIVVWHRLRERRVNVTTRLWVVDEVRGKAHDRGGITGIDDVEVTLDLDEFLDVLQQRVSRGAAA